MEKILKIFTLVLFCTFTLTGQDKKIEIGIDEQLGRKLPLELEFYDESGDKKPLGDFIKGTTVLAFVYYECPGICSPLMSAISDVVNRVDLKPNEDYNIVTISFDQNEDAVCSCR
jgi:protein SCO1